MWVLVLGGTLWLTGNKDENANTQLATSNIISAGEKKARLTFADGSTVEVSEKNTHVLKEKGVDIEYKDGEISYVATVKPAGTVYNELEVPRGGELSLIHI